jgi:DNA-binding FadR family transcriptional regulator
VIELAYEYQVPMAIEYAGREATTRPINLEFHNKSLREMVEAIVKQDQQYRVSFSDGVVDIFSPRAREDRSNLLNKVLKDFSVTEMETREADFQLFCAVAQAAGAPAALR